MGAGPHLPRVDLEHVLPDLGVVEQAQGVVAIVGVPVEPGLVDAEADGDGAHDLDVQLLAPVVEVEHGPLEADQLARLLGPVVRVVGLALAPDLEALLQVGHRVAQPPDGLVVRQRRGLLAPGRRVAPVRLGRRPGLGQLGLRREREVPGRRLEDVPADVRRDRQAPQVDEARRPEAVEDRVRGLLALPGGALQEGGEVDELFHGQLGK